MPIRFAKSSIRPAGLLSAVRLENLSLAVSTDTAGPFIGCRKASDAAAIRRYHDLQMANFPNLRLREGTLEQRKSKGSPSLHQDSGFRIISTGFPDQVVIVRNEVRALDVQSIVGRTESTGSGAISH